MLSASNRSGVVVLLAVEVVWGWWVDLEGTASAAGRLLVVNLIEMAFVLLLTVLVLGILPLLWITPEIIGQMHFQAHFYDS